MLKMSLVSILGMFSRKKAETPSEEKAEKSEPKQKQKSKYATEGSLLYPFEPPQRKVEKPKEGFEWCSHCNGKGMCKCASCGVDTVKQNTKYQRNETRDQYGRVIEFENRPYTHVETVREEGICKVCNGMRQIRI